MAEAKKIEVNRLLKNMLISDGIPSGKGLNGQLCFDKVHEKYYYYSALTSTWLPLDTTGSTTFIGLTDTPMSYAGHQRKGLTVNVAETGLVYENYVRNFIDLIDVPDSYIGHAGEYIRINSGASGLEFATVSVPSTFLDLTDTPSSYSGHTGEAVIVNASGTGLEFGSAGASTFLDLTDTPANYSGDANKLIKVSSDETQLEYSYTIEDDSGSLIIGKNDTLNTKNKWYGRLTTWDGSSDQPSLSNVEDWPRKALLFNGATLTGSDPIGHGWGWAGFESYTVVDSGSSLFWKQIYAGRFNLNVGRPLSGGITAAVKGFNQQYDGGVSSNGTIAGAWFEVQQSGDYTVSNEVGVYASAWVEDYSSAVVNNCYAFKGSIYSYAKINYAHGLYTEFKAEDSAAANISQVYGIRLKTTEAGSGTITNATGFYLEGTWTYGLDFSSATLNNAEIKGQKGDEILNSDTNIWEFVSSIAITRDAGLGPSSGLCITSTASSGWSETGTIANAPVPSDPDKWIKVYIDNVEHYVPAWSAPA